MGYVYNRPAQGSIIIKNRSLLSISGLPNLSKGLKSLIVSICVAFNGDFALVFIDVNLDAI